MTLQEKIEECVRLYESEKWTKEFALHRKEDGSWSASIGGHWAVSLGEWEGDLWTEGLPSADEAVDQLLKKIKEQR